LPGSGHRGYFNPASRSLDDDEDDENTLFDAKTAAILPKMCSPELHKKLQKNK